MSNNKQGFVNEAVSVLMECASDQATLKDMAVRYIKVSFTNGLNTGYQKAYTEMKKKKGEAEIGDTANKAPTVNTVGALFFCGNAEFPKNTFSKASIPI